MTNRPRVRRRSPSRIRRRTVRPSWNRTKAAASRISSSAIENGTLSVNTESRRCSGRTKSAESRRMSAVFPLSARCSTMMPSASRLTRQRPGVSFKKKSLRFLLMS